jgi:uncharacterized protein YbjT (DUF2867 family)
MIGQGVLRECLMAPDVDAILAVGRSPSGQTHPKLRDLVHRDLYDLTAIEPQLTGFDACFFCLGATSAGLSEPEYHRITFDLTLGAGRTLARVSPGMTFIYISGAGADSTEQGRTMWARVKGQTENAILKLPLRASIFRPAVIQPMHGIRSRTSWYRVMYAITGPLMPVLKPLFPGFITTTEAVGRAMLEVARHGPPAPILQNADINRVAGRPTLQ